MTAKQRAAVEALRRDPSLSPAGVCDAAGVAGGFSNRPEFLWRLVESGAVRLVVNDG